MSEAFDAYMGAACWTDPAYAPDAATWAAAWKAAKRGAETLPPRCGRLERGVRPVLTEARKTMSNYEPAFTRSHDADGHNGMTLRDYFAAKAMAAMIAQYPCQAIDDDDGGRLIDNDALTGDAYDMADAMMTARERS